MSEYEPINLPHAFVMTFVRISLAVGAVYLMLFLSGIIGIKTERGNFGADDIINLVSVKSITYTEAPFFKQMCILTVSGSVGVKRYEINANELELLKDLTVALPHYYPTERFSFPDWSYIVVPLVILCVPMHGRRKKVEYTEGAITADNQVRTAS